MSTDLVPTDNMAALDAMDPATREVAVTNMLAEARSWLAHAVEATSPRTIANFKAEMATVAEATRQLGLSKEIQLDAQEMVRRAERGVGTAIRKGQDAGEITDLSDTGRAGKFRIREANSKRQASEFFSNGEVRTQTYAMAAASDEEFEDAIAEAKTEGNLSRTNVVRKVKTSNTTAERLARVDVIRDLAAQGYSSRQMPAKVGVSEAHIRTLAREFGVDIHADKVVSHTRRLDHTHMVESAITSVENTVDALKYIDFDEVDWAEAGEWVASLTNSLTELRRFLNKIKETTHV